MTHILVFGASITWGAWDREGGWVQRLRRLMDERNLSGKDFHCLVYNLGVSGDTTRELLGRLESELRHRIDEEENTIVIFSIGMNDSQFIRESNSLMVFPDEFQKNLGKLAHIAQRFHARVIFLGLTPVDERVDPIQWAPDRSYRNEYVKQFNDMIEKFCIGNKIDFIDIFESFMQAKHNKLLEDGVHPNSKGHERIFRAVSDFLAKNRLV